MSHYNPAYVQSLYSIISVHTPKLNNSDRRWQLLLSDPQLYQVTVASNSNNNSTSVLTGYLLSLLNVYISHRELHSQFAELHELALESTLPYGLPTNDLLLGEVEGQAAGISREWQETLDKFAIFH